MKKGDLPIQYINWLQSPVFHLSWDHLLYLSSRVALRLEPEGRRGRSGGRDLRLCLNRLSTISCILSPVFILISRNAHAANCWAVSEFQDINQVISWLSSCIAEDLAFSLLQSYPSTVNPWTTGLNCAGPLTHFFSISTCTVFHPSSQMPSANCMHWCVRHFIQGTWASMDFCIHREVLEPISPMDTKGQLKFWGSQKLHADFWLQGVGVGASNVAFQESIVLSAF